MHHTRNITIGIRIVRESSKSRKGLAHHIGQVKSTSRNAEYGAGVGAGIEQESELSSAYVRLCAGMCGYMRLCAVMCGYVRFHSAGPAGFPPPPRCLTLPARNVPKINCVHTS